MEEEQLIEAVRQHRELYDLTWTSYRNLDVRENAWKSVADKLNQPVNENVFF